MAKMPALLPAMIVNASSWPPSTSDARIAAPTNAFLGEFSEMLRL